MTKIYASGHSQLLSGINRSSDLQCVMYPLGKKCRNLWRQKVIENLHQKMLEKIAKEELLKDAKFVNERKFLNILVKFSKDGKLTGIDKSTVKKYLKPWIWHGCIYSVLI